MLTITVPATDTYDEAIGEFIKTEAMTLSLEHSLVSLSRWESKWEQPFLSKDDRSNEEAIDYVVAMTLTPDVPPEIYQYLTQGNHKEIADYIDAKMTATTFSEINKGAQSREVVTSELIYYWMITLQIPFECQDWHLSRLLTLIKVCNLKNQPAKKMSPGELAARNRKLNEERQQKYGTEG